MTPNTNMIWVSFSKEGTHCYPAALTDPTLQDVSFLGYPHRHTFHFKVWIAVTHDDREIEFIQFKRWLTSIYSDAILCLDAKSCEMISNELHTVISTKYPNREIWIEVSEDNENGSFITYHETL